MNVNDIKRELTSLGVSTSTPGLQGDDRYEELSFRLEQARKQLNDLGSKAEEQAKADGFSVPSLGQLSIGEIRSRLTALGESTATPGLTGEERRSALMKRLINAICVENPDGDISELTAKQPTENQSSPAPEIKVVPKPPPSPPPEPKPVIVPVQEPLEDKEDTTVSSATISVLKKELKRLANQRALYVAARLSGNSQDEQLKNEEAKLARIEAEMSHFRELQQKGETKLPTAAIKSEFLVLNPAAQGFAIEALVNRLEGYRSSCKEKIRDSRLRIREEGDEHPQFGLAAEEKLKILLSEANLASAANVTSVNTSAKTTSRTRQKFAEVKAMESQLEQQGKVAPSEGKPSTSTPVPAVGAAVSSSSAPSSRTSETTQPTTGLKSAPAAAAGAHAGPAPVTSPGDKWSTNIMPNVPPSTKILPNPVDAPVEPPSKLPTFTSAYLGKAIDLDASPSATSGKTYQRPLPADRSPPVAAAKSTAPITPAVAKVDNTAIKPVSGSPPGVNAGRKPPPPTVPVESGLQDAPQPLHQQEIKRGAGAAASKVNTYNREESSDEDAGSSEDERRGGHRRVQQGHAVDGSDEDEYFREADDAVLHKYQQQTTSARIHPIRNIPLPSAPPTAKIDTELAATAGLQRTDSANEEELVGAYDEEDLRDLQTGSKNSDSYHLYGMPRRQATAEDDDDLEELTASARSPSRTHSSQGSGAGDRPPSNMSGGISPIPNAGDHPMRMPSIDENEANYGESTRGEELRPQHSVERKLDYVTVDPARESPFEEGDDAEEGGGHGDADGDGEDDGGDAQAGLEGDEVDAAEREADEKTQIRVLRSHAKVLENLNDIPAAEEVHMRALELDPTNITTLEGCAIFLHQKKGELARAEAFFNRGLQICLPGLSLRGSANNTPKSNQKSQSGISYGTDATMQGNKITHIVRFIMSYAHFMSKSKGDLEAAGILYRKGVDLAPDNAFLLATYAHFLAQLGDKESATAAMEYFQRALKLAPGNAQYCMWYGKLLKRLGKTAQAELMYKVALEQSKGNPTLEPTAICNYATFVFKLRKDPARAHDMFRAGLAAFPGHKGLRKNHAALLKACPQFGGAGSSGSAAGRRDAEAAVKDGAHAEEKQQRGNARAEWLARKAQNALRNEGAAAQSTIPENDEAQEQEEEAHRQEQDSDA